MDARTKGATNSDSTNMFSRKKDMAKKLNPISRFKKDRPGLFPETYKTMPIGIPWELDTSKFKGHNLRTK